MNLFKTVSFYFSILGFVMAIVFLKVTEQPTRPVSYIQKPSVSPFEHSIAATGIVEALDKNIEVGSPQEGVVYKVWPKVGEHVKRGDPLFQLDTSTLRARLAVQRANKTVEEASLEKQRDKLGRLKAVEDLRAISQEDIQVLEDDVRIAEAKLEVAKAEIVHTKELLDELTVRSPKDGVILQLEIRKGEYVSRNKPVIILGNLDQLQLRVSIDEQNAGKFVKGSPAVALPKNNSSVMFSLDFLRIEPLVIPKVSLTGVGREKIDTRVLQVIYAFDSNQEYPIYVGQQMDVYIEIRGRE